MTPLPAEARSPQAWASLNNAIWCDTVCAAHGVPGEFDGGVWLNRQVPPPYHSNLVTLGGAAEADAAMAQVRALLDLPLPHRWTVKAGQAELDLAPLGFEPLFDATWIWREPDASPATARHEAVGWSRLVDAPALAHFNHAWSAGGTDPNLAGRAPQFPASMRADPNVAFLATYDNGHIVGGGIANRTGPVVGLSNTFGEAASPARFWAGLVAAAQAAFPGRALVGYEHGSSLHAALAAGFAAIGPLRVWIRHG